MSYLIDGFNLIYKFPELESLMYLGQLNKAKEGLLDILKEYQAINKKRSIKVVFDGKKDIAIDITSEKAGKIDVYYSLEYSADFLIKQFIKKDLNPKMCTVITSDKDIIVYVTRLGAGHITSEKFADMVNHSIKEYWEEQEEKKVSAEKENPSITQDEISYWQKLFKSKPEK